MATINRTGFDNSSIYGTVGFPVGGGVINPKYGPPDLVAKYSGSSMAHGYNLMRSGIPAPDPRYSFMRGSREPIIGYVPPPAGVPANAFATASESENIANRLFRKKIRFSTPFGTQNEFLGTSELIGDDIFSTLLTMEERLSEASAKGMPRTSTGRFYDAVKDVMRQSFWKDKVTKTPFGIGEILPLLPDDIRTPIKSIINLAKAQGLGDATAETFFIQGMDDIAGVLHLNDIYGKKAVSIPLPVGFLDGKKLLYSREGKSSAYRILRGTEHGGFTSVAYQDIIGEGGTPLSYLQAMVEQLTSSTGQKQLESTGKKTLQDQLECMLSSEHEFAASRTSLTGRQADAHHMYSVYSPALKADRSQKGLGLTPLEHVRRDSIQHMTGAYSHIFQSPSAFLKGNLSTLPKNLLPFGEYYARESKPAYQAWTTLPTTRVVSATRPVLPLETDIGRKIFQQNMPRGYIPGTVERQQFGRALVVLDQTAQHAYLSSPEVMLMSKDFAARVGSNAESAADASMVYMFGASKGSMGGTPSNAAMMGYDIITGMMPKAPAILEGTISGVGGEAFKAGKLPEYKAFLGKLGIPIAEFKHEGETIGLTLGKVSPDLDYRNVLQQLQKHHKEMGYSPVYETVVDPSLGYASGRSLSFPSIGVAPRDHHIDDMVSYAQNRMFRPAYELRHLKHQGQKKLVDYIMERGRTQPHITPELIKSLSPFMGRSEELLAGSIPGIEEVISGNVGKVYSPKDIASGLGNLLTPRKLTAGFAGEAAINPMFQELYHRGLTVDLGEDIALRGIGDTKALKNLSVMAQGFHIPAIKATTDLSVLMDPALLDQLPFLQKTEIFLDDITKTSWAVLEATSRKGRGERAAIGDITNFVQQMGHDIAKGTGRDSFWKKGAGVQAEIGFYPQIVGGFGTEASGIPAFDRIREELVGEVGKKWKSRYNVGIGEVSISASDLKKLGIYDKVAAYERAVTKLGESKADDMAFFMLGQAEPGISAATTIPLRVRIGHDLSKGVVATHVADRINLMRDLDRDSFGLLGFKDKRYQDLMRDYWLDYRRNLQTVHEEVLKHWKKSSTSQFASADAMDKYVYSLYKDAISKAESTSLGAFDKRFGTKLSTGITNTALEPLRFLNEITKYKEDDAALLVSNSLGVIEQSTIAKGKQSSNILEFLQSVITPDRRSESVPKLAAMLEAEAASVLQTFESTSGSGVFALADKAVFESLSGRSGQATRAAGYLIDLQLKTKDKTIGKALSLFRGNPQGLEQLINTVNQVGSSEGYNFLRAITSRGEDWLTVNEKIRQEAINSITKTRSTAGAMKGLWASTKHWFNSLPAWGKAATIVGGSLAGLAMFRGLTATPDLGPIGGMSIPPEVGMKEMYGTQVGAPPSPEPISMPMHSGAAMPYPSPSPPARLTMNNNAYDVTVRADDNVNFNPSAVPEQIEALLHQHVGTNINTSVRVQEASAEKTRHQVMTRVADIQESRFYAT